MAPIPTPVPPVGYAGPVLLGALFSYMFMGTLSSQFIHYIQNTGTTDKWAIRTLAIFVFACQLTQIALTSHKAWRAGVLGFMHPEYLNHQPKHRAVTPILNGLVAISVQGFFAWRIHKIKKGNPLMRPIPAIICVLCLLHFSASIALGVDFLRTNTDPEAIPRLGKIIPVHLSANMVADVLINICMFIILYGYKQKSSVPRTRSLLSSLIRNTVENGLITTTLAVVNVLLYVSCKGDLTTSAFRWVVGFVDANVLLTTLNRREEYRGVPCPDNTISGFRFATIELTDLDLPATRGGLQSDRADEAALSTSTFLNSSDGNDDTRASATANVNDQSTASDPGTGSTGKS